MLVAGFTIDEVCREPRSEGAMDGLAVKSGGAHHRADFLENRLPEAKAAPDRLTRMHGLGKDFKLVIQVGTIRSVGNEAQLKGIQSSISHEATPFRVLQQ